MTGITGKSFGDITRSDDGFPSSNPAGARSPQAVVGLSIAWSFAEPSRVGEIGLLVPGPHPTLIGRGPAQPDDDGPRMPFSLVRPGDRASQPPFTGKGLSRVQLRVTAPRPGMLRIENAGRAALFHNGRGVDSCDVTPGDRVYINKQMLLLCVDVPALTSRREVAPSFDFGAPDAHGIVGESHAAWALRERLEFCARRAGHVLVLGPSGAGKELCARALHSLSSRRNSPFVARNAATIPAGIIDAELFGNAKNFPNAGMSERAGIVGAAHGGMLFLDEIAEVPEGVQSHLLRLLDHGEYHRLGEDRSRRADLRIVGATNRHESELKHDLNARFVLRIEVPGLDARRVDIPLLTHQLLRGRARLDREIATRFFDRDHARLDPALVEALIVHDYTMHVRELDRLLLSALATTPADSDHISFTPEVFAQITRVEPPRDPPTADEIRASLKRHAGNVSAAWKDLGLHNRDVLRRLMKTHGIV